MNDTIQNLTKAVELCEEAGNSEDAGFAYMTIQWNHFYMGNFDQSLTFNELKERLQTSDGNLSVHARRLEEAGYLEVTKSFEHRMPRTEYRLTARGKKALERYLDHMEALIERVRE